MVCCVTKKLREILYLFENKYNSIIHGVLTVFLLMHLIF